MTAARIVDVFLRYFWFICAGVVFVNAAIWRGRVNDLVSQGRVSVEERDAFIRALVLGLGVPCLFLGGIAGWAGYSNPSCAPILSFHDTASVASWVVVLLMWAAILRWVWVGSGADLLSRIGPVLWSIPGSRGSYSPKVVRRVVTALVLIAAVATAFSRWSPSPGCSVWPPAFGA